VNKEVSCVILQPFINALQKKHLSPETLCAGVPYDLPYLTNKLERVEWDVYCTMMANLRPHFTEDELVQLGVEAVETPMFHTASIIVRLFTRVPELYAWFAGRPGGPGTQWFACITGSTVEVARNRVIMTLELPEGYRTCREFFLVTKGSLTAGPRILGLGLSTVTMHETTRGAIYDIICPEGGGSLSWIRKAVTWPLAVRRAARELNDANETLLARYVQLEELQGRSQRQAMQLKAAYDIGRLFHSDLDLDSTLHAIVRSLVEVAPFSAATISLDGVTDEESVTRYTKAGAEEPSAAAVTRALETRGRHLGEVNVWLKPAARLQDAEELLNYLVPTITMEVDDALSFKIVNDYRASLQRKVDERTRELQEMNDALKRSQAGRDRLFSNISHEFRTPLTLILGPLDEMLRRTRNRVAQKQLSTMKKNAEKVLTLINQLLELSRLQSGDVKLSAHESDFVQFLRGLVMTFRSLAETRHIRLTFQADRESCPLFFDPQKAETLFNNLILNAFKFTPDGGKIEVRIRLPRNAAEVLVRDSGVGIPADELPHIFDRFYQGGYPGQHTMGGTGIGLALTKELTELHHGTVRVTSAPGAGTEFLVTLRLGRSHLKDEECDAPPPHHAPRAGRQPAPGTRRRPVLPGRKHTGPRKTILVIDDDQDVRMYIRGILAEDAIVIEAADGEQGIERARKVVPDLIVCDVMMPRLDGYGVCRALKEDLRTSHIPIILLTAKAATDDRVEGLETGADDYVVKPFEARELRARIRNLIALREKLRRSFTIEQVLKPRGGFPGRSSEYTFLQKATGIAQAHMGDESFSIEAFSNEIGLSRAQLHRKIVALTNLSARDFLRSLRLQRAHDLLCTNAGNVSEIAYQTGFRDPSHFARLFRRQYGVAPTGLLKSAPRITTGA